MNQASPITQCLDFLTMVIAQCYLVITGQEPVNVASLVPLMVVGLIGSLWIVHRLYKRQLQTAHFLGRLQFMEEFFKSVTFIAPPTNRLSSFFWLFVFMIVLTVVSGAAGYLVLTQS